MTEIRGWQKIKRDSLMNPGITEVAFLKTKQDDQPWSIVADHTGVIIRGESPKLYEAAQLDDFAFIVADAMREYLNLKKARIVVIN